MKIRIARHTQHLQPLIDFYCGILGMEYLGGFTDHDGYDGVFLGLSGAQWHLEFTTSNLKPDHTPDEDDLLVFYCESKEMLTMLKTRFEEHSIFTTEPVNPYWKTNGLLFKDPDGFGVVLTVDE